MGHQRARRAAAIPPRRAYRESRELIDRWHGKGRQRYAVTPRFAATSSVEQLWLRRGSCWLIVQVV